MPHYIVFSLLAAFAFACANLINKFASKHTISNHWVLLFYYYLTALPFVLLIPLFFKVSFPTSGWLYVFLYALAFFAGNIFFTTAIYKLDASTFAPFMQLQSAFIVLFAFLFLGERFSAINYLFISLMLIGSVLATLDEKMNIRDYFKIGILLIIMQQVLHALSNLSAGFALKHMDSFTFIFWGDLIAIILIVLLIPFLGVAKLKVSFSQIKPLFLSGLFSTIGAISLFTAFMSNLTISSSLALLTAPIVLTATVIASIFKPDLLEHHTAKVYLVRAAGVALILFSAIQLAR